MKAVDLQEGPRVAELPRTGIEVGAAGRGDFRIGKGIVTSDDVDDRRCGRTGDSIFDVKKRDSPSSLVFGEFPKVADACCQEKGCEEKVRDGMKRVDREWELKPDGPRRVDEENAVR